MLRSYLLLALRIFRRRKFFTAISLFGIALTLVILVVCVALYEHTFGPQAPETRLSRSLGVQYAVMKGPNMQATGLPGYKFLDKYVRTLPGLERMSVFTSPGTAVSFKDGQRIAADFKRTDADFWRILDFTFVEGTPYGDEDVANGNRVAVLSRAARRRFFGSDAPAVGKTIELDGDQYRVAGVVEDVPALRLVPYSEVWAPLGTSKDDSWRTQLMGSFMAVVLARSEADLPGIRAELNRRLSEVEPPAPFTTFFSAAETLFDTASREVLDKRDGEAPAAALRLILAALAGLFMLLPAVNLINLNVSRILERASEIGVRKAFGASSRALVAQFVVENVLLSLLGGAVALVASTGVLALVNASGVIPHADLRLNLRVLLDALLLAMIFGVLSGAWPALRMSRLDPVQALKGGSR